MNRRNSILAVSIFAMLVIGSGYAYQVSEQKQSAKLIKQIYSQIVYPSNFVRTSETDAVMDGGLVSEPIQIYTYRADATSADVSKQLVTIFEKSGYKVKSSYSLVEGFDKQLKLTAVLDPKNTTDVQVITVTAKRAND